jgi:hypothetical protein
MSFEAYKIAVHLGFTSNGPGLLTALGARLFDVESKVKSLTGSFNRMHLAMYGGLSLLAGGAFIKGIEAVVNKTKDLSNELVKLERLGGAIGTAAASGELTKRAFDIAQRVPMNVVDLLKIPGATYSIVGQKASMDIWEEMAKFGTVMQSQNGFSGDVGSELQKLLRAAELSGRLTDPVTHEADIGHLRHFLDLAARIVGATHGMVNPSTMLGMAQQGGFALRGLSDEGFYTQAILAQAMGGPRSGTALLSLWQQMAGGVMFKRSAEGLQDIGMLGKDEWRTDHGRVILGDTASKRLTAMIGKDPLDFASNMIDKLKEHGISDPEDQMRKIMRALGRQTTQRYTAEEVTNFHQMIAERGRLRGGLGAGESFGTIMNKDVSANLKAMHEAWNNLLYAIAGPNSENTVKILQNITNALKSLTDTINQMNPDTLRNIATGFGIFATALVGAGAVALIAALGPAGWLVAGIGSLVAAFVAAQGPLTAAFNAIIGAIKAFVSGIAGLKNMIPFLGGGATKGTEGGMAPGMEQPGYDPFHKSNYFAPAGGKGSGGILHANIHIDGEKVGRSVSKYQVASALHPNAIGAQDSYGSHLHPGTYAFDSVG